MSLLRVSRTLLIGLCLAAASAPAWAAQAVDRVVAVVGDEVITSLDVEKLLGIMQAQISAAAAEHPGQPVPGQDELRRMALDRLIEDKIFAQEVARSGVSVGKDEVDHYIERIKKMNQLTDDEFAAQLSRRGVTPEEYKADLKHDLLKHKLVDRSVKSRVVIGDKEVEEYHRNSGGPAAPPSQQARLRALFLLVDEKATPAADEAVRQRAEELHKKVVSGDSFAELARRHSQGPGAQQGGELGPVNLGDLLPEMRQALAGLKPGQVSQVVRVPNGYVFMQLMESSLGGAQGQLTPELREQIRGKLESEALDKRFREWLTDLRSKVYVKILEP